MKTICDLSDLNSLQNSAITIGNFDGVHRGHRLLLNQLVKVAKRLQVPSIVFSFDPHPLQLLNPTACPAQLVTVAKKSALLSKCGVDILVACPTTPSLLSMSYGRFFDEIICGQLKASAIVEGPNFHFGKDRKGSISDLVSLCQQARIQLEIVQIEKSENQTVSSSLIRQLISEGEISEANRLLDSFYCVGGVVRPGSKRGAGLGFPTANLHDVQTLVPGEGVYGGYARHLGDKVLAAIHVGPNLTFGDSNSKLEVHLIGEDRDLYNQEIEVEFHQQIRKLIRFASTKELSSQIQTDIQAIIASVDK